jgi:hypothetical protein
MGIDGHVFILSGSRLIKYLVIIKVYARAFFFAKSAADVKASA